VAPPSRRRPRHAAAHGWAAEQRRPRAAPPAVPAGETAPSGAPVGPPPPCRCVRQPPDVDARRAALLQRRGAGTPRPQTRRSGGGCGRCVGRDRRGGAPGAPKGCARATTSRGGKSAGRRRVVGRRPPRGGGGRAAARGAPPCAGGPSMRGATGHCGWSTGGLHKGCHFSTFDGWGGGGLVAEKISSGAGGKSARAPPARRAPRTAVRGSGVASRCVCSAGRAVYLFKCVELLEKVRLVPFQTVFRLNV